jgi:hypothetical protein
MFPSYTTFIGIDPTAGQRPFSYAAIDIDLNLLALGEGDIDEVLAFAAGQRQAFIAVSAPRRPNTCLMEQDEVRQRLNPQPRPGRWTNFRVAEYQLRQHNIYCPNTAAEEKDCPNWMQMGFTLYRRLEKLGYQPYPQEQGLRQWLEVYPHASYTALLGLVPFQKSTLEGKIQRQLALFDQGLSISDPMRIFEEITRHRLLQGILPEEQLYSQGELDALVSAFTAWKAANHPEQTTTLGETEEGTVIIPVPELKKSY